MQRFKNILVVCEDGGIDESALMRAKWIAYRNRASITLIDVVDAAVGELARLFSNFSRLTGRDVEQKVLESHWARLEALAEPLRRSGITVHTQLKLGTPFIEVIRCVIENGHDLVLKTAQKGIGAPFLLGPDLHLVRKCPCHVWILNNTHEARTRRILAAVDPDLNDPVRDGLNQAIMELATSLAEQDDARLDVISVWRLREESTLRSPRINICDAEVDALVKKQQRETAWRLTRLTSQFPEHADRMRTLHIKGIASDIIPEHVEAEEIDTIVMGTIARTGIAGFVIGNTAETILTRVPCSVLTVKPRGFVSPVQPEATIKEERPR